jgi:hypothetical protein
MAVMCTWLACTCRRLHDAARVGDNEEIELISAYLQADPNAADELLYNFTVRCTCMQHAWPLHRPCTYSCFRHTPLNSVMLHDICIQCHALSFTAHDTPTNVLSPGHALGCTQWPCTYSQIAGTFGSRHKCAGHCAEYSAALCC